MEAYDLTIDLNAMAYDLGYGLASNPYIKGQSMTKAKADSKSMLSTEKAKKDFDKGFKDGKKWLKAFNDATSADGTNVDIEKMFRLLEGEFPDEK